MMSSLGLIPQTAKGSESVFAAAVQDAGGTMGDVPRPETTIA